MKNFLIAALLASLVPSTATAQQEISPSRMHDHLKKFPIVCLVPAGTKGCTSIDEFAFLTSSKGMAISTGAFEINRGQYLRITLSQPFRAQKRGYCVQGTQPIRDAHLEVATSLKYRGNFGRKEVSARARDLIKRQVLNPLIDLLGNSTICTRFFMPRTRSKNNEIGYVTYLDGEVLEQGRAYLYGSDAASRLKLTPAD